MSTKKILDADVIELGLRDGMPPTLALPATFQLEARKAEAEQQAKIDAASGAYDQIAVEVLTKLPYEQLIDNEIEILRRNAAQSLPTPTDDDLEPDAGVRQASARRAAEEAELDIEREKRREISRVLAGDKRTHDDVEWSGTDPAAPTSDGRLRTILRGEVVRTWLLSFGLTAVLLCAETYVMMRNVTIFIHGETPMFSLILALVLALIMTSLPHAVGAAVITSRRRERTTGKEKLTIFLLTPVWLTIGVLVGLLRTFATQRLAVLAAADQQGIPLDKVDVASAFHFWINLGLWTSIALGVGFALFAVKTLTYNPYRAQAVKLDTAIALRESRLRALASDEDAVLTARSVRQREATATFDAYRRMYGDALPAAGELVKTHYRASLTRLVGRPDFTTALAISGSH